MENTLIITIEKIYISDKSKQGIAYIDKNNKPYKRSAIKSAGNPNWISANIFFPDDPILSWQVGETHEIVVEDNVVGDKTYWNFRLPKKDDAVKNALTEQLNRIEQKVDRITSYFEKKELTPKYPEQIPPKGNNTYNSTAQVDENGEEPPF